MTVRAGLLVVGHVAPGSVHLAGDYPELFADLLAPHGVEVVPYAVDEGQVPAALDECDGWVCSPSRLSVYDDAPWIGDAEDIVRELVVRELPFVGICFGHQLLAQALGGRVERAPSGWGIGVHDYEVTATEPWMRPPAGRLALIASHQDQVVEVPGDVRVIASAPYCPVAGLAVGARAWTIQPHPEFTGALADHVYAGRAAAMGEDRTAAARASLARPTDRDVIARWIAATLGAR